VTLCDASALIALLYAKDRDHARCLAILPYITEPLVTTWPCLAETMHILGRYGGWQAQQALWNYIEVKVLVLRQQDELEQQRMQVLMEKYRDIPMDLGDASLVAAAEAMDQRLVFTLDRDFHIYRFHGNCSFHIVPR